MYGVQCLEVSCADYKGALKSGPWQEISVKCLRADGLPMLFIVLFSYISFLAMWTRNILHFI